MQSYPQASLGNKWYYLLMEIRISNSKVTSVDFPKRKNRNVSDKNWDSSKDNRIVLEKSKVYIDGNDGSVIVEYKAPKHFLKDIANGKIDFNKTYYTDSIDPELSAQLDQAFEMKYKNVTSKAERNILMLLE